ncbi:hypothetical protein D3C72_948460 [compost metagenome]
MPQFVYNYKYQGQERQDELELNWDSFKWRNYDYAIGRFMSIDPLAEDYSYQSPYAFAENKVIDHVELEGLEGLHHTLVNKDGIKSHLIEKNVLFLRQNPQSIPASATPKQAEKIRNKNMAIANQEFAKITEVKDELSRFYGGTYQNSAGENVTFSFTFSEKKVDNTDGDGIVADGKSVFQLAHTSGLEGADGKVSPATVFTTDGNIDGAQGKTVGAKVFGKRNGATYGTWAHEFIHSLGLPDNGYNKGGVLNSPPEPLSTKEIDKIIEMSYSAKQKS